MELKPYQQQVINDLARFLANIQRDKNIKTAFFDYWTQHPETPLQPFTGTVIEPYKNNIVGVPHVCVKVPTAGGKTFIACNALQTIFENFDETRPKTVVWLVPSITILDQTIKNLRDTQHPYRQKINTHFGSKVEIYDKQALLTGAGFNATAVQGQLSILVLSFDSLRARNKDDRKIFQESGRNLSFVEQINDKSHLLEGIDETALINIIRSLNPVLIVDESHNAESELSVEMLKNLNPSFILDLTATPRRNSNIISFVDALALKNENMVKLPVIVYNHHDKNEVINSALQLQRKIEVLANEEQKQGGRYIRPIVLFQAQARTADDNHTFEKVKEILIKIGIPSEQIKIKTANNDELKGIDLMAENCQVRYIITVNALKEGWDCPFAYILASLADRSSAVDVEQIVGRVLRQPYVKKHKSSLLNLSYVLTASSRFRETLQSIVNGLNKAGYSSKDYKVADFMTDETPTIKPMGDPLELLFETPQMLNNQVVTPESSLDEIDITKIKLDNSSEESSSVQTIETMAMEETKNFENMVEEMKGDYSLPSEIQDLVNSYSMREHFAEQAKIIKLPQFFFKTSSESEIFDISEVLLAKEHLLKGFDLNKADRNINFSSVSSELYKIDLEEKRKGEYTPSFMKIDGSTKNILLENILPNQSREGKIKTMTARIVKQIGNIKPIPDKHIENYVKNVLNDLTEEQFHDLVSNEYSYSDRIKEKIKALSDAYAATKFREFLDTDSILVKPNYQFPTKLILNETSKDIIKCLYAKAGKMNGFEEKVINEVANLENVAFWTRNMERKGFCLNGFINHYPDFIIVTKKGKIIILETKGDDRDNSDSEAKLKLANYWEKKAGDKFRYFMVFEKQDMENALTLDGFMTRMKEL